MQYCSLFSSWVNCQERRSPRKSIKKDLMSCMHRHRRGNTHLEAPPFKIGTDDDAVPFAVNPTLSVVPPAFALSLESLQQPCMLGLCSLVPHLRANDEASSLRSDGPNIRGRR